MKIGQCVSIVLEYSSINETNLKEECACKGKIVKGQMSTIPLHYMNVMQHWLKTCKFMLAPEDSARELLGSLR